jgi:C-5 cytosine-specific DNA methylase
MRGGGPQHLARRRPAVPAREHREAVAGEIWAWRPGAMTKLFSGSPDFSSSIEKPICYDLYCGLGGWAEGFLSEGFHCIGYDIEKHDYGTGTYPGELVICDVRSIHGSQLADAACIVASPPCQEPSYRAMPWKRAKALNAIGPPHNFIELFNACFRIQREASEAAGRYIPLVVENVVGAQRWVGRARWHFGSYYLWGDVPALMPVTFRQVMKAGVTHRSDGATNFHKIPGQDWSRHAKTGEVSKHWKMEGIKQRNPGQSGWFGKYQQGQGSRNFGSNSIQRKAASAEIAKIPFPLAQWIARCYKPRATEHESRIAWVSA